MLRAWGSEKNGVVLARVPVHNSAMAELFLNPNLPNYFVSAPEVTPTATARSYVDEYEAAKVICFPNLGRDIDHDFWANLDTDKYPELKKFGPTLVPGIDAKDQGRRLRNGLVKRGVDEGIARTMCDQFLAVCGQLLPAYEKIFSDYSFDRRKVMWRLNTIMAENMHVDTYKHENETHFARMFVNLDTQPRIWHTSWRIQDMVEQAMGKIAPSTLKKRTKGDVWSAINSHFYGQNSREWWDEQPRHIAFFAPGDVWVVDSRQVSHQIFYGRRALSIDFSVPKQMMKNPDRHYLEIADAFRAENKIAYDNENGSAQRRPAEQSAQPEEDRRSPVAAPERQLLRG